MLYLGLFLNFKFFLVLMYHLIVLLFFVFSVPRVFHLVFYCCCYDLHQQKYISECISGVVILMIISLRCLRSVVWTGFTGHVMELTVIFALFTNIYAV